MRFFLRRGGGGEFSSTPFETGSARNFFFGGYRNRSRREIVFPAYKNNLESMGADHSRSPATVEIEYLETISMKSSKGMKRRKISYYQVSTLLLKLPFFQPFQQPRR